MGAPLGWWWWAVTAVGVVAGVGVIVAVATLPAHANGKERRSWAETLWWLAPLTLTAIAAAVAYVLFKRGAFTFGATPSVEMPVPAAAEQACAATTAAKATCGATDPVSDPKYNMTEIVKQSILLEEHLVEPQKRCKDCIVKHFLHIIALGQEAQMLAGTKKLPMLDTTPTFYEGLYKQWLERRDDTTVMCGIEEKLRERRKELVAKYILT